MSDEDDALDEILDIDIVNAFTDWRAVLGGILLSFVVTLPALSVLRRKELWDARPNGVPKSYLHSCALKFLTGCAIGPILVKGFLTIYERSASRGDTASNEEDDEAVETYDFMDDLMHDLVLFAAAFTEVIEFIFDFSRLVLFYQTPPPAIPIDAYQNLRWNITIESGWRCFAACCSVIPMVVVMFLMWILVLLANIAELYAASAHSGFYAVVIILASIGAILLLSMACSCCCWRLFCCFNGRRQQDNISQNEDGYDPTMQTSFNQGEVRGNGFFWAKFKLIAVDTPSWIVAILDPSAIILFWLSETLNDLFPYLLKFTYLEQEVSEDEENIGQENNAKMEKGVNTMEEDESQKVATCSSSRKEYHLCENDRTDER